MSQTRKSEAARRGGGVHYNRIRQGYREDEQAASLAAVAASGRFSKLLKDCSTDELGVRIQQQTDVANKMMKKSLSLLIKQIVTRHCQNLLEEVRSTKKINVALLQENKELRKAIQDPLKAGSALPHQSEEPGGGTVARGCLLGLMK